MRSPLIPSFIPSPSPPFANTSLPPLYLSLFYMAHLFIIIYVYFLSYPLPFNYYHIFPYFLHIFLRSLLLLLSSLLITIFTPIRSLPFIPLPLISTLYLQFTSSFPFYFFLFPNIFLRSSFIISISFLFFFCSFFQLYFSTVFLHSEQIISSLLLLLFPTLCTRSFRPYLFAYLLAFFLPFSSLPFFL